MHLWKQYLCLSFAFLKVYFISVYYLNLTKACTAPYSAAPTRRWYTPLSQQFWKCHFVPGSIHRSGTKSNETKGRPRVAWNPGMSSFLYHLRSVSTSRQLLTQPLWEFTANGCMREKAVKSGGKGCIIPSFFKKKKNKQFAKIPFYLHQIGKYHKAPCFRVLAKV